MAKVFPDKHRKAVWGPCREIQTASCSCLGVQLCDELPVSLLSPTGLWDACPQWQKELPNELTGTQTKVSANSHYTRARGRGGMGSGDRQQR